MVFAPAWPLRIFFCLSSTSSPFQPEPDLCSCIWQGQARAVFCQVTLVWCKALGALCPELVAARQIAGCQMAAGYAPHANRCLRISHLSCQLRHASNPCQWGKAGLSKTVACQAIARTGQAPPQHVPPFGVCAAHRQPVKICRLPDFSFFTPVFTFSSFCTEPSHVPSHSQPDGQRHPCTQY